MAFGLFLQIQALPAEEQGRIVVQNKYAQRLHSLTLAQLDTVLKEPELKPEVASLVKDEILKRVRGVQ